ncbi:hypothetical protein OR221_3001, partial [Microbacterium laevaniformans OR221]
MSDFAVRIDIGLLIDTTNALEVSDIKRVLRPKVAWVRGFNLTTGFIVVFFAL